MLFPPTQRHQAATRNVLLGLVSPLESHGVLLAQLKAGSEAGKVPTEFAKRLRTNSEAATSAAVVVVAVILMLVEMVLVFCWFVVEAERW